MRLFRIVLPLLALSLLTHCAKVVVNDSTSVGGSTYANDPATDVYINDAIIESVNTSNSRLVIALSDQPAFTWARNWRSKRRSRPE